MLSVETLRDRVLCATIALLLLAGLSQAVPTRTYACTPTALPGPQAAWNKADAVFAGKVVAVDNSPFGAINALISGTGQQRVLFNITSIWKGPVRSQAIVNVATKVCGVSIHHFYKDEGLLVFANNGPLGSLEAPTYSRTQELAQAAEDIQVLGQGKSPAEQTELETLFYVQSYWVEAALGVFLMSAFIGIVRANRSR